MIIIYIISILFLLRNYLMSWLKKKVSGKRRRLKTDKYDLDISYITDTVIAMSFPAHEWKEKFYRNNVDDVVGYLD